MCLHGSVGLGGQNRHWDVKTVQILLNAHAEVLRLPAPLAEDGGIGPKTLETIEAFQRQIVGMATPDRRIDPGGRTLARLREGLGNALDAVKLTGIMIHATAARLRAYSEPLCTHMAARGINTQLRQGHFLAQIGHESGELRYNEEIASGDAYEGRLDLGNTHPGDGRRFKGRGLIQLTGRANYQQYSRAIGRDLTVDGQWEQVADDPNLAVDVACWFWDTRRLSPLADADDIMTITRRINGGTNGIDDRRRLLGRAKFFLGL